MKTKKSVTSYSTKLVLLCVFSLISYLPLQAQDSVKIGWFSFNIYSALVINKSFRSLYDSELYSKPLAAMSYYNSIEYTSIKNDPVCFGYSGGIEGVFGRKKFK